MCVCIGECENSHGPKILETNVFNNAHTKPHAKTVQALNMNVSSAINVLPLCPLRLDRLTNFDTETQLHRDLHLDTHTHTSWPFINVTIFLLNERTHTRVKTNFRTFFIHLFTRNTFHSGQITHSLSLLPLLARMPLR